MDSNDLFSDTEYSFRQTRLTLDYLNTQHQRLTQEHDIMVLAFDITKAFDRVWLNGSGQEDGVWGRLHEPLWIFLRNHATCFVLNRLISSDCLVEAGDSKESILRPHTFLDLY